MPKLRHALFTLTLAGVAATLAATGPARNMPMSALETATIAKSHLQKQGVPFRT